MFRFTIRDVLWLMVVVGLFLAWGIVQVKYFVLVNKHQRLEERLNTFVEMMRSRGYTAHASDESGVAMSAKPMRQKAPDENQATLPTP